nr:site-specific integrase [Betaproteobacteria bacterium]
MARAHPDAPLIADYLEALEHRRRLSPHTLANYARDLGALLALLGDARLAAAQAHDVRRAVVQLAARGLSGRSLARTLSAWRGLYRWLARHRGFAHDPCAGIRAPKAARILPGALTPEAAQRLLEVDPGAEPQLVRDHAMFELLYSSGLRLAELVALDAGDGRLDLAAGEVTVTGKGRKTRSVPIGSKARAALAAWLGVRGALARPGERALFVGARGERIAPGGVQRRLRLW